MLPAPAGRPVRDPSRALARDPRGSTGPRVLVLVPDHTFTGAQRTGAEMRYMMVVDVLRGLLPADVISIGDLRALASCTRQCAACAAATITVDGRPEPAPFNWMSCARAVEAAAGLGRVDGYAAVFASGALMHPYAAPVRDACGAPLIVDLHNAEADLYETMRADPDWERLNPYSTGDEVARPALERELVTAAAMLTVPSTEDRRLLRHRHGTQLRITVLPNAVAVPEEPMPVDHLPPRTCAYIGDLSWFPNILASRTMCQAIAPAIRRVAPDMPIVLAGRQPPPALAAMAGAAGVRLIADPPDMAPILHRAILLVPLTLGGGTRLKILEAFAAGVPVVASAKGIEGIDAVPDVHYLPAEEPSAFADAVRVIRADPAGDLRRRRSAWELARDRYSLAAQAGPMAEALTAVGVRL